jgi:hypothetical protein
MKINRYSSQYTIINGHDGSIMINATNNITDFNYYNATNYRNGMSIALRQIILYVYIRARNQK